MNGLGGVPNGLGGVPNGLGGVLNGLGGVQHGVVSNTLRHFSQSNFPCTRHEAHDTQVCTCSSMNKYNFTRYCVDAQSVSLDTKCLEKLLLPINTQHYSLFQIAIWRQTSLVPRSFLPSVFDHLRYAKTEREGLGERVTCMTSGRHEGRHEGGGARSL